ncbi:MAG: PIG-L deacetylase family protein [Anaerolineales bacterium]
MPHPRQNPIKSLVRKSLFRIATPELMIALKHLRAKYSKTHIEKKPFPQRNLHATNSVPARKVLVLSPHPDDEAIGLGGALSMHIENQSEVTVLYLTDGRGPGAAESNSLSAAAELPKLAIVRRKEAESIGDDYPINQIFWEIKDNHLTNDSETVSALVDVLTNVQPELIYLPSFFDHHYDHFSANQVLVDALNKFPHSRMTILGYEVWDNTPFPNHILDISAHFEQKAKILSYYKTPLKYTDFIKLCRHRNALHYLLYVDSLDKQPEGYAEAFYRLDSITYRRLFDENLQALKEHRSLLPSHLVARRQISNLKSAT